MQQTPRNHNSGDDGLMLIAGVIILAVIMWFAMGKALIYGVTYSLFWLYDALPGWLLPHDIESRKALLYQAAVNRDQLGFLEFLSVLNQTAIILLPLYLIAAAAFAAVILKSPFYRLTRGITVRTLPWIMVKHATANAHVLARFGKFDQLLLNEDPEEAKSPLSPVEFAEQHQLIDTTGRRMRRKEAHRVFLKQVNIMPDGQPPELAPWEQALAAAFVHVRFMSDRPTAKKLLDALNLSCLKTRDGFPDFSLAADAWQAASCCDAYREFIRGRVSSRALLHALFDNDLKLPPAQFRWLKGIDRTLWMALSSVGRGKYFVEGAGVIAWSQCETRNHGLSPEEAAEFPPTVRAAVLGLDQELRNYGHIDLRQPALTEADSPELPDAPPFALQSDIQPETPATATNAASAPAPAAEAVTDISHFLPDDKPATQSRDDRPAPAMPTHLDL